MKTLQNINAMLQAAASNSAHAVTQMPAIAKALDELIPTEALCTRVKWDRAGMFSFAAIFQDLTPGEQQALPIRCPHDLWIRGITAMAIPDVFFDDQGALIDNATILQNTAQKQATNYRSLFEFSLRIDDRKGFYTSGVPAADSPANLASGDGTYQNPLDWKLQRDVDIDVSVRNVTDRLGGIGPNQSPGAILRFCSVTFWCYQLNGLGSGAQL